MGSRKGLQRKPHSECSERGVAVESPAWSEAEGYAQNIKNNLENKRTFALPHDQNSYIFTMKWEYDTWNRIKNISYPDGERVYYSYDRGGNLKRIKCNIKMTHYKTKDYY